MLFLLQLTIRPRTSSWRAARDAQDTRLLLVILIFVNRNIINLLRYIVFVNKNVAYKWRSLKENKHLSPPGSHTNN
jgi:hypothetical protein